MCPNLKLQWLRDNGYSAEEVERIYNTIVARFNGAAVTYYPPAHTEAATLHLEGSDSEVSSSQQALLPELSTGELGRMAAGRQAVHTQYSSA